MTPRARLNHTNQLRASRVRDIHLSLVQGSERLAHLLYDELDGCDPLVFAVKLQRNVDSFIRFVAVDSPAEGAEKLLDRVR